MSDFRQFTYKNVPIELIRPYRNRHYTFVEFKIVLWMAILCTPKNWRGHVTARLLADGTYELLTGHHRFEAIKRLGWTTFPLEIYDYTDEEAEEIYETDNSLAFAPTAGMAIGSTPGAIALYKSKGICEGEARERVRKGLHLTCKQDIQALVEMHAALEAGTLTEKIRDVLDIPAAIAFWEVVSPTSNARGSWMKEFGEVLSVQEQEDIFSKTDLDDVRRDLPRACSDKRIAKRLDTPQPVVTKIAKPKRRVSQEELLIDITNKMAAFFNTEPTEEEEVSPETLAAFEANYQAIYDDFHKD